MMPGSLTSICIWIKVLYICNYFLILSKCVIKETNVQVLVFWTVLDQYLSVKLGNFGLIL